MTNLSIHEIAHIFHEMFDYSHADQIGSVCRTCEYNAEIFLAEERRIEAQKAAMKSFEADRETSANLYSEDRGEPVQGDKSDSVGM